MAKTYIPTLVLMVRDMCKYLVRYQVTIRQFLPSGAITAFDALMDGCNDFLVAMTDWDNVEE